MQLHTLSASRLYEANIKNLTDLWKAMGAVSIGSDEGPTLHASESWPHRLWFDVEQPVAPVGAERLIEAARDASRPLVLPVWREHEPRASGDFSLGHELSAAGHDLQFEQSVMSLELEGWRSEPNVAADIELHTVDGDTGAWAETTSSAFGYTVDPQVTDRVVRTPGVTLMTARRSGHLVGTGLIYAQDELAGIHMVGIVPEARRMGIARRIMIHLLNHAQSQGSRHALLQASAMGESLYTDLGFEPQGRIRNFSL